MVSVNTIKKSKTHTIVKAIKGSWGLGEALTSNKPLVALSSKNCDGLKKLPYRLDHFFRQLYIWLGPTVSAQKTSPPLKQ